MTAKTETIETTETVEKAGCDICHGHLYCCPGCSGFAGTYPDLFMGCGVSIRCPKCFGYDKALKDKKFMEKNYNNDKARQKYYEKFNGKRPENHKSQEEEKRQPHQDVVRIANEFNSLCREGGKNVPFQMTGFQMLIVMVDTFNRETNNAFSLKLTSNIPDSLSLIPSNSSILSTSQNPYNLLPQNPQKSSEQLMPQIP